MHQNVYNVQYYVSRHVFAVQELGVCEQLLHLFLSPDFLGTSSWPSTGNFSDNCCWIADHSTLPHPILYPSEETEWLANKVSKHLTVIL